ncbi:hypothetical protein EsCd1HHP024_01440 [Escherichia sp. HH091_1A]|nr:hypothetical protein EsCd1HHP024_01440 [Escherichia sp. HH091_1A]
MLTYTNPKSPPRATRQGGASVDKSSVIDVPVGDSNFCFVTGRAVLADDVWSDP